MKKQILTLLVVAISVALNAQTSTNKWGIGVGAGTYGTLNRNENQMGVNTEIYLSRYLSPKFNLAWKGDIGINITKKMYDYANPIFNLEYKLSDETKKIRPYLFGGPGVIIAASDPWKTKVNMDLGVGALYSIKDLWSIYGKAGFASGLKYGNKTDMLWRVTFGLNYDLGKVADADMDGVTDKNDKCPNTPTGVKVDSKGCPIDSDNDKVADYIDDCPTVAGLTSLKGCPDKDKDGIADKNDACPDVAGTMALKGCPDADADGIGDKDDKCPFTPAGVAVDTKGCPKDTDSDGVADYQDGCPTVAGLKENKGCPETKVVKEEDVVKADAKTEVKAISVEPVYFEKNKSVVTATEKAKVNKVVTFLKENKNFNISLTGNTDNTGTEKLNANLSKSRTNSVVSIITSGGIKKDRITTKSLGSTKPAASNDTPEGMAKNRRVEFEIVKTK